MAVPNPLARRVQLTAQNSSESLLARIRALGGDLAAYPDKACKVKIQADDGIGTDALFIGDSSALDGDNYGERLTVGQKTEIGPFTSNLIRLSDIWLRTSHLTIFDVHIIIEVL